MIKSKSHLLAVLLPSTSCCVDADGFVEEGSRWYKALVNTALPTQDSLSHPVLQRLVLWSSAVGKQNETLGECEIYTVLAVRRASRQSSCCAGELPPSTLPCPRCLSSLDGPLEKTKDDFLEIATMLTQSGKDEEAALLHPNPPSCSHVQSKKHRRQRRKDKKKQSLTTNHTYTTIFCHATQQQHVTPSSHNSWHSAQRLLVRRMLTLAP